VIRPCPKPEPREPKPRKGLKRSWMRKRKPRRLSRPGSDPAYLAWVRTQPCVLDTNHHSVIHPWDGFCACEGRTHAHHAGRKPGVAMKADDSTAIPLCDRHHRQWHDANGVFAGLTKLQRFAWSQRAIADTQGRYSERSDER
jgi:hypothetical protein